MEASCNINVIDLTESLKQRLNAGKLNRSGGLGELKKDLFDALDLLAAQNETLRELESESSYSMEATATSSELLEDATEPLGIAIAGKVTDALDDSLSQWQVQIETSCTSAISRELREQINSLRSLSTELKENQRSLDAQRSSTEAQLAEALRLKSRYSRQRKTLAKEIRAQRAELLLAVECERDALREQIETSLRVELTHSQSEETEQRVLELESQLADQKRRCEETSKQLEESGVAAALLEEECQSLQEQIASSDQSSEQLTALERELHESQELIAAFEEEAAEKEQVYVEQIAKLESELTRVCASLETSTAQLQEIHSESQAVDSVAIEDLQEQLSLKDLEVAELREQLEENARLEDELNSARKSLQSAQEKLEELSLNRDETPGVLAPEQLEKLDELEQEVYNKQLEILDLRSQNSDLASQIAKYQVVASGTAPHVSFNQESLSWEERKQLIMQQLERELDDDQSEDAQASQLEIQDVLAVTQLEIERRDREIEELQSIVQQQSNTREGVAIGAAAIAQMLDSDELVNQERQKLKEIQQEWEEKLRKTEIDLSLERAKLARERSMLEAERIEAAQPPSTSTEVTAVKGETKAQTRTRKWLQHLGLKQNENENE